ncbi:hypothetical protein N7481_004424 [Penicillium waksmanii]|uniref:uncharacterized protein n=1 Tax=Penicillium waksmanii TaxID=69791 RepID=UPI002548BE4D|nr:uncharacterized protein N7481_004424 [Penicillium waksmanii]KAJ5989214.1 hypothetical protein N7481_004424 [Penicillium waksmanii]
MPLISPPRVAHDEADSPALYRFNAIEPLNQLQDLPPVVFPQPAGIDADIPPTTSKQRRRASSLDGSLDYDVHLSEKIAKNLQEGQSLTTGTEGTEHGGLNRSRKSSFLYRSYGYHFNLPGVPYAEPCFAATEFRDPDSLEEQEESSEDDSASSVDGEYLSEKTPLVCETRELRAGSHTHRWNKPLVGVVYEVTLSDYAKIIATEGGGGGYRDIVVDCHAFPDDYRSTDPVPSHPDTPPFKAHTLLSPQPMVDESGGALVTPSSCSKPSSLTFGRHMRPNLNYAQPSARYLDLITTGAREHNLPVAYQEYLSGFHSYQITTFRQKVGKVVILLLFGPIILSLFALCKKLAGPDGRSPAWLLSLLNLIFATMWHSYDCVFKKVFGDGERTMDD